MDTEDFLNQGGEIGEVHEIERKIKFENEKDQVLLPMEFYFRGLEEMQMEKKSGNSVGHDIIPEIEVGGTSSRSIAGVFEDRNDNEFISEVKIKMDDSREPELGNFQAGPLQQKEPSAKQNFCTIVGREYLFKFLALYESLERYSMNFHIWVCCVDEDVFRQLRDFSLEHAAVFQDSEIECSELPGLKKERKKNEYCWTLKAPLIEHILTKHGVKTVIYCDSDVFFFSNPSPIFDSIEGYSVLLCPNHVSGWTDTVYGRFQAGLIGFRGDEKGLRALRWWKESCIKWCFDDPGAGSDRWGDQKYLDKLYEDFEDICIADSPGIDAAPWNVLYFDGHRIEIRDGRLYIDNYRLVVWHFARLSIFNEEEFDLWEPFELEISGEIIKEIYIPYIEELRRAMKTIEGAKWRYFSMKKAREASNYFKYGEPELKKSLKGSENNFCTTVKIGNILKAMALYYSIKSKMNIFCLWMCCEDDSAFEILSRLSIENVNIIKLEGFSRKFKYLEKLPKGQEGNVANHRAALVSCLLEEFSLPALVFCEPGVFFYGNPEVIFGELKENSYVLASHEGKGDKTAGGKFFESGLFGVRKDEGSRALLEKINNGSPEDLTQGEMDIRTAVGFSYLDTPLNISRGKRYALNLVKREVFIGSTRLGAYNFKDLLILGEDEFDLWRVDYIKLEDDVMRYIYIPYLRELKNAAGFLASRVENGLEGLYEDIRGHRPVNNVKF